MQPPPYGPPPSPGGFVPPGGFAPPPGYGAGLPPGLLQPGSEDWAKGQVAGPAIALMIVSGLAFLWYVFAIIVVVFAIGIGFLESPGAKADVVGGLVGGGVGAAMYGFWALMSAIAFFGAMRMRTLKSYGLAMTSAIIAVVPCTTYVCCTLMFPFGVWALVVLMKPEVKAAFK